MIAKGQTQRATAASGGWQRGGGAHPCRRAQRGVWGTLGGGAPQKSFTLIEILVAMAILSVLGLALMLILRGGRVIDPFAPMDSNGQRGY